MAEKISQSSPHVQIQHLYKTTLGDADLNTPLNKMPDIGVFTNDIREDLLSGTADIAVHSWKDLPVELEEGTTILGTLERADMRDMVFLKKREYAEERSCYFKLLSKKREKSIEFLTYGTPL